MFKLDCDWKESKLKMLLNKAYYRNLRDKFRGVKLVETKLTDKASLLTTKMIVEHNKNKKSIQFNFQNSETLLNLIGQHLFIELANDIYCNAPDYPPFNVGDKLRSKNRIKIG